MEIIIQPDADSASQVAGRIVARLVQQKPDAVLGLATGSTPVRLYQELIRLHRQQGLDFSRIITFNLDEYVGLAPDHPASYHRFMRENLFDHINLPADHSHLPDGLAQNIPAHCQEYERKIKAAGGIDLQVLGIGSDGHIAFNEPSSSLSSRTRIKGLMDQTRSDNARFFDDPGDVPTHAITMGVGTILEARTCLLLAFGENKAWAVSQAVEGPVSAMVTASALQLHPDAKVVLDEAAASRLTLSDYYRWVFEHKPAWQEY